MSLKKALLASCAVLSFIQLSACKVNARAPAEKAREEKIEEPKALPAQLTHKIPRQSTLYEQLRELGLSPQSIIELIENARSYTSLDKIPVNFTFYSSWSPIYQGPWKQPFKEAKKDATLSDVSDFFQLDSLEFLINNTNSIIATQNDDVWVIKEKKYPVSRIRRSFFGNVNYSLWDSATQAGMPAQLISQLTEIFAWQVDFGREVRPGDKWRLVVDELFVRDKSIGWGSIQAAEYINREETYTAVRFELEDGRCEYFAPDGQSLRRMFLKSPIEFGRISSKFTKNRFHPILKRNRPHNGVDYAAPIGTPVRAVGDGRISYLGRNGGSGKMIKIRHNSTYVTAYLHLNAYKKGLRRGVKVKQGDIIGYVGKTGLATGPHLHFEFHEHGRYVDPMGIKFPSADPVPAKKTDSFKQLVAEVLPLLPSWSLALQESTDQSESEL